MQILGKRQLDEKELAAVEQLRLANLNAFQFSPKIFWNIISERQSERANDYLFYQDTQLIAYLACFDFNADSSEISLVLEPGCYDKRHIAEVLLAFLTQTQIVPCYDFIIAEKDVLLRQLLDNAANERISSHAEMWLTAMPEAKKMVPVRIIQAQPQDLVLLAQIGTQCFASDFCHNLARFAHNLEQSNRCIWLVYYQGKVVGKIHVRFDFGAKVFLHDLGIVPEWQGKGLGKSMLRKTINLLQHQGYRQFYLDVEHDNRSAIKLYQNCGFVVQSHYEVFRLKSTDLKQQLRQ